MGIVRIIKINFLALIALPLLLLRILAASAKLIADAIGKAFAVIRVAALIAGIVLAFAAVKNSDWTFEKAAALSVIAFINMIDAVYRAVYAKGVQKFYCTCVYDNAYELLDMKPQAKKILCFAYTLWDVLNRAVGWFVRHALRIFALGSVFVACGYAINAIARIYLKHGMNPFQYLGAYGSYDVIGGMIVDLAALTAFCIVLISMGYELSDRGEALFFPYSKKKYAWEDYFMKQSLASGRKSFERKATTDNERYERILIEHIKTFEGFMQEVKPVAKQCGNDVLRADYEQYVSDISSLVKASADYGGQIPAAVFEKMIPIIERLDAAKKRIRQQTEQARKGVQTKVDGGFFKGCDTKEKLEKRYKALCKTYHPDSESGDEDTFKRMSDEYEMRKKNFT